MRRASGFLFLLTVSLFLVSAVGCAGKPAAPAESGPAAVCSEDTVTRLRSIREYNLSLPEGERIVPV